MTRCAAELVKADGAKGWKGSVDVRGAVLAQSSLREASSSLVDEGRWCRFLKIRARGM
jgi:hypothetical protein